MLYVRMLGALFALGSFAVIAANAQCTAQQSLITVTLDNADAGLFSYTWTILNEDNGNGNRLQDVYFEIADADTASTVTTVASWLKTIEIVDATWTSLRFTHSAGPKICSGGGQCSSPTETFTYTLDKMISSVRIRTFQANSQEENFSFDSSMLGCGSLPVELTSFKAAVNYKTVALTWTTASEVNTVGFEVEGRDKGTFTTIAFIPAAGSANAGHEYRFDHLAGDNPPAAYRLKMVDADGGFEYSHVIELAPSVTTPVSLTTPHPNPFASMTTFNVNVTREQHIRVDVFDATGRIVTTLFDGQFLPSREDAFRLDGTTLAPGLYFIRAQGEDAAASGAAILVR